MDPDVPQLDAATHSSTPPHALPLDRVAFLRTTQLCAGLGETALQRVAADLVLRRYQARDTIFHEGDPGHQLYLVQSGQVRIFVNGLDGTETSVILIGRPGQLFGELAIIDGLPRSASAIAMDETLLLTLERDRFRHHMSRTPQLALNFMQALSRRLRYNTRQYNSVITLDIARRLARKLLELAQDYGVAEPDGVRIDAALNQSELASLIGATRERTNKALGLLRSERLIAMRDGAVIILDAEGLHGRVSGSLA
jgi:CRP-like cAMP-binding protein